MSLGEVIRALEQKGIDLLEVLGEDSKISAKELRAVLREVPKGSEQVLYSELLFQLTYKRFDEEEAQRLWDLALRHKRRLQQRLGRGVGFRVALLDYLENKRGILEGVRLLSRETFEEIVEQVDRDCLTEAFNRRYFLGQLQREIALAKRYRNNVSLLMVDLNGFKLFNDTRGHLAGDRALRKVSLCLREAARSTDIVCRYGGDEFGIVCPRTVKHDALTLADRLRGAVKALQLKPAVKPHSQPLSLSVGVATHPEDAEEFEDLIEKADQSLYRAKEETERLSSWGTSGST